METTLRYKGYTVYIRGPINHWGRLKVTAHVTKAPRASQQKSCPCSREAYIQTQSKEIDEKLTYAERQAKAREYFPEVKRKIKAEIDRHLARGCFTPIGKRKS